MNIDPLAEKYNSWTPYNYALNNPVLFIDPDGREIDISELMKNKNHAKAFMLFAKTKEGKSFLDNFASAGQKLEYGGKVFYEAGKEAGKYDKAGIDLNYGISDSDEGSEAGVSKTEKGFDININIAKEGFGSENKTFNLVKSIVHESFLHGELHAKDLIDGKHDKSSVPLFYRAYDGSQGSHAQHYYVSREYAGGSTSPDVLYFPNNGLNALRQISKNLNLNYSDTKIKTVQWNFSGSLINVDPKSGKISYKK